MKIRHSKRAAAVLAVAVVASAGFAAAAHGATTDHDVRASDFNPTLADQRTNGHLDFLKEGVRLYTDGNADTGPRTDGGTGDWNTDKVAQYYAPASTTMPTSSGQDWYGTDSAPGMQIVFDYDGTTGNGNDYNVLVGEKVYNGTWWLTNGSSTDAKAADPSGANDGGNGSAYFGTLQQWKDAMPNARVLAYGFSLGSGVKGDGVLRSQTFGDDSYVFTDEDAPTTPPEPTTVNPAGYVFKNVNGRTVLFQMKTASIPDGSKAGDLPNFRVSASDSTQTLQTPAPGTSSYYANTCPKKTTCTYKAYKGNSLVYTVTIKK